MAPMSTNPRRSLLAAMAAPIVLALAACAPMGAGASPTPSPAPTSATALSAAELRLLLIDRLGPRWYCDPDEYPVARGTEQERAIERFPEMQAEGALFGAISRRLGIDPAGSFTDAQKLAVYRVWKVATSIPLQDVGSGSYRFDYTAQPLPGATQGTRTAGLISDRGVIKVEQQAPADEPICPICLARGSLVDTPDGPVQVEALRLGAVVWTVDTAGRRVPAEVIAVGSTSAPVGHEIVRLRLSDGRSLAASPGHALADGRRLDDVRAGDLVDGATVVAADRVPYDGGETFDIAVSGATGIYLVGGIPLRSTIR